MKPGVPPTILSPFLLSHLCFEQMAAEVVWIFGETLLNKSSCKLQSGESASTHAGRHTRARARAHSQLICAASSWPLYSHLTPCPIFSSDRLRIARHRFPSAFFFLFFHFFFSSPTSGHCSTLWRLWKWVVSKTRLVQTAVPLLTGRRDRRFSFQFSERSRAGLAGV